ncbi:MAG: PIN domain-containing protein [Thiothrix sp.]|uniref:PIN domain-containing protein n=1 Tax=Thiothrix sp. TaxID=1032 RepID=UPI00262A5A44|nr:PIN domain-containing protein [Thiothrix sp.]MDD5392372.1 PIN domain-containing protein [Thiothrix sp.]
MQLIDTNVILRYLLADNEALYQRACTILEPLQQGETQGTITEGVLIECVYVLLKVYEIPRPLIADKLSAVLSYAGLYQPQYDHYIQALEIFAAHNVDIVDALLFTRSQQEGSSIQSFDKDIQKLIKRLG